MLLPMYDEGCKCLVLMHPSGVVTLLSLKLPRSKVCPARERKGYQLANSLGKVRPTGIPNALEGRRNRRACPKERGQVSVRAGAHRWCGTVGVRAVIPGSMPYHLQGSRASTVRVSPTALESPPAPPSEVVHGADRDPVGIERMVMEKIGPELVFVAGAQSEP